MWADAEQFADVDVPDLERAESSSDVGAELACLVFEVVGLSSSDEGVVDRLGDVDVEVRAMSTSTWESPIASWTMISARWRVRARFTTLRSVCTCHMFFSRVTSAMTTRWCVREGVGWAGFCCPRNAVRSLSLIQGESTGTLRSSVATPGSSPRR